MEKEETVSKAPKHRGVKEVSYELKLKALELFQSRCGYRKGIIPA